MSYDYASIYQFLTQTPEGGLRKMLVDNKPMNEGHFNLLMKVVRSCKEEDFANHYEKQDFPKVKMSPSETKVKEVFWKDLTTTLQSRGLLALAQKKVA
jgi:hypothetical protein